MTVKPADLIDDDETGAGKGTGKGGVARQGLVKLNQVGGHDGRFPL